jgi:hypothetical protein
MHEKEYGKYEREDEKCFARSEISTKEKYQRIGAGPKCLNVLKS